jgi:aldehyde dehydrogenase (NAD+)/betaine-aldehyde dehydrogenase
VTTGVRVDRWVGTQLPLLIGGTAVPGAGPVLDVVDPATEEVCARVASASSAQLGDAVAAARRAFDHGPWPSCPPAERSAAIHRIADGIDAHHDELVAAIVSEVGSPVALARSLQVGMVATHLRWYAEQARADRTESLGAHADPVASQSLVAYRPVGVVAAIAAYNYPLLLATHKLGAALAAGCTVVLMPSPRTPVATLLLAEILRAAELPPGVVNVVVGDARIARQLTEHPEIDKIAFTGSTAVGEQVMAQAATGTRGVVLELGGKSPAVLFPDADVGAVLPDVLRRYCRNGGQACAAPTLLIVPESAWDEVVEVSRATLASIAVGDPWAEDTLVGPMISAAHRLRVEGFTAAAVADGGELVAGGGRPDMARGWFTNPALVAGVDPGSRIAQEEIFGPVAVAFRYRTVDEAIELANCSRYGLHSYLYTADHGAALAACARLRTGSVSINGGGGFRPDAPMGGFGTSGVGRELGRWGVHEYLEPQHIQWRA